MKALVIGGTRFVGLRLVRELARQGHQITLLNRGKTQAPLPPGIQRLYADRRDPQAVKNALQGQSFDWAFDITGYQLRSVEPVVDALAGKVDRYFFQSTAGVYADSDTLPTTEESPLRNPQTALAGFAAYEIEKVQCELYLMEQFEKRRFPATIIRCPIIFGPENWMHDREFSFFVRLLQKRPILVPGNGNTFLSFAYADDVAKAHIQAAWVTRTIGQVYNVASPEAMTINGFIDAVAQIAGAEPRKTYIDFSEMKTFKQAVFPFRWDKSSYCSIQKAREHFLYKPEFDIKSGLRQTYEWWSQNLGIEKTVFAPGKLGNDVDLAYEAELAQQYG